MPEKKEKKTDQRDTLLGQFFGYYYMAGGFILLFLLGDR